jgi:hypothetical protein
MRRKSRVEIQRNAFRTGKKFGLDCTRFSAMRYCQPTRGMDTEWNIQDIFLTVTAVHAPLEDFDDSL